MLIAKLKSFLNLLHQNLSDLVLMSILATISFLFIYYLSQSLNPILLDERSQDLWFQSDAPRVLSNMISRTSNHWRTKVHPIFSLITYPPIFLIRKFLGIDAVIAARFFGVAVIGIWVATLFALLRLMRCSRLDAFLFSLLGVVSSASIFWFTVPETYPLGSLSILSALFLVALSEYRQISTFEYVLLSAFTLSFTITNWMVGIFATLLTFSWKKRFKILFLSLILVALLCIIQKLIFPTALFPFQPNLLDQEKAYIYFPNFERLADVFKSFMFHTLIMPSPYILPISGNSKFDQILTQASLPGSAGVWGLISILLWLSLLSLGVWSSFKNKGNRKLKLMLTLSLAGQFTLSVFYGEETFLYSLHFLPLLITFVSLNAHTHKRALALFITGILVITASVNNLSVFHQASTFLDEQALAFEQTTTEITPRR